MNQRPRRLLAFTLFGTAVLQAAATAYLIVRTWDEPSGSFSSPIASINFTIVQLGCAVVGAFIALRRPENAIGWVCMVVAGLGFDIPVGRYLIFREFAAPDSRLPHLEALAAAMPNLWLAGATGLMILVAIFPRGRPSSRPMTAVIVALPLAALAAIGCGALKAGPMPEPFEGYDNPIGAGDPTLLGGLAVGFMLLFVAGAVATIANTVYRFRRSRGEERQQFKWFALGASAIPLLMVTYLVILVVAPGFLQVIDATISVALISIPVSIGIAVLRHRLYDIDVLINRTLVYGSLTAMTVGSYVALVVVLSWATRALTGEGGNEIIVAATTLIVAALFQPARRRIQSLVDRRFYRSRYDGTRTVEAFQARLRDQVDIQSLRTDLAATVHSALQPASVGVWLRPGGGRQ